MEVTTEDGRVPVGDGVELRTLSWHPVGAARRPAFLLVHGLASNALLWRGVGERLAAAGHPAVAVDQRGHGRSGGAGDGVSDLPTLVADLRTVIATLDLARPVVVGQSWGGNVVLELGRRAPADVLGVVGVDGGVIDLASRFPDWDACRAALTPPRLAGLAADDLVRRLRERFPNWSDEALAGPLASFDVRADGTVAPHLALDDHLAILRTLWEHRPAEYLPEVQVPVLLLPVAEPGDVGGAQAKRRSVELAGELLADLRVHWFTGRSHDVHAEAPDEVVSELLRAATAWAEQAQGGAA